MTITLSFPKSDTGLLQWSQNVVDLITPVPATYGLVALDVTTYTGKHDGYASALAACDPSIRSKPAVVAKNQARDLLKQGAVLLANKIYADASVTDAQKTELGMPPRATPTPVPPPSIKPVVEIVSRVGWTVKIRLRAGAGAGRGLPAGCIGASIFSFVGEESPADIGAWKFEGSTGRVTAIDVTFPTTLAAGTCVWVCAFYFNGRKQSGPACDPVSANLPGGSVEMAA